MRLLATMTLALIGNAVGLIVAAVILENMTLNGGAFVVAVAIFTLTFIVAQPFTLKMALRHSTALAGGSALLATLLALVVTDLVSDGLSISGLSTWLLAPVIVWMGALLAGVLLPLVMFKKVLARATDAQPAQRTTTWR